MKAQFFPDAGNEREPFPYGRWSDFLCWTLILIGAGLRIGHWLHNRSLWLDESFLAVNLLERGFDNLHTPLDFNQSAPWLFLVATKGMAVLFGPGEMVLRFLPLTSSILSLWVFWRVAKACLEGWWVPVALSLLTFSFRHLYYAQELKQYSWEILLTLLVVWQAARMFRSADAPSQAFAAMVVIGGVGIFAMHAMPFVLVGTGLVALWAKWRGQLNLSYRELVLGGSLWLALFTVNYFVILRPNYANPVMRDYWAFAYPAAPLSLDALRQWVALLSEYLWYLGYVGVFKALFVAMLSVGLWRAVNARNFLLLACIVTGVAYWLAGMAGRAPFHGRLILFLLPLLLLFLCQGMSLLIPARHWSLPLLAACVAIGATGATLPRIFRPIETANPRDPIVELSRLRKGTEPVYVMFWAVPAFRYYRDALQLPNLSSSPIVLSQQPWRFISAKNKVTTPEVVPDIHQMMRDMSPLLKGNGVWLLTYMQNQQEEELLSELKKSFGLSPDRLYRANACSLYHFNTRHDLPAVAGGPGI